MSTKDCIFVVCLGIMLALMVCAFGVAADLYGKNGHKFQEDCISKGGSWIAVTTTDKYHEVQGHNCVMPSDVIK